MNIFFVSSPFQYICANEARVFYKTKNNILILEIKDTERGINQINDLIIASDWDSIFHIEKSSRTLATPRLIKNLKEIANKNNYNFESFFFSEYRSWIINLIKRNIEFRRHVYFDDGTATLYEYDEYIKNKVTFYRPRLLQDLLIQLQGCKKIGRLEFDESLELFTIFNIKNSICKLKSNQLNELRKNISANKAFDENAPAGIIGQGAVGEDDNISLADYFNHIEEIASAHKEVLYFPHRSETNEVESKVKTIKNIIYHKSKKPLELEIACENIALSCLYGMVSTALYTLSIVYKEIPINLIDTNSSLGHENNQIIQKLREEFNKTK